MDIYLQASVEDGGVRGPGVASNHTRPVAFPRGAAVTIHIELVRLSGAPDMTLAADEWLMVMGRFDGAPLLQIAGVLEPSLGPNRITFSLTNANTASIPAGQQTWEVWRRRAKVDEVLIALSPCSVAPATEPPPAAPIISP